MLYYFYRNFIRKITKNADKTALSKYLGVLNWREGYFHHGKK